MYFKEAESDAEYRKQQIDGMKKAAAKRLADNAAKKKKKMKNGGEVAPTKETM
jgi:hypothetical protein